MSDGTMRCWGSNDSHQLGDPELPLGYFAGPAVAFGLRGARSLALGGHHSCAITDDASAWCWGRNAFGQLATGDTVFRDAPTRVIDGAAEIVADDNTCVISPTGDVRCWGVLLNGQRWDGLFGAHSVEATTVALGSPAVELAIGSRHGCATVDDGNDVVCWGRGVDGRLGDGNLGNSPVPVSVAPSLATPVHQISAAGEHTCVLAGAPPEVQCWGAVPAVGGTPTPTAMTQQPDGEVVDLQCGWRHTCALLSDGRVQCWGLNFSGSLGHDGPSSAVPTDVDDLTDAAMLAVGNVHACVIRMNGKVACWGANNRGQLSQPANVGGWPGAVAVSLEVGP